MIDIPYINQNLFFPHILSAINLNNSGA